MRPLRSQRGGFLRDERAILQENEMSNMKEITVPLNRLKVAEHNVRKTPADALSDAELKASLASLGLLQNLVVHEDEMDEGYYGVDAGRRRVTQLHELVAEGVFSEDMPIHCVLIEDASIATEVSLVENTMRADMHPADQVEAFAQLVREGSTVAEIAMRFGMAERAVEQRLRLGNVAPELMQAYREGKINLETLKGFAVTPDHDLQLAVWKRMNSEEGYYYNSYNIRNMLLESKVQGNSRLARFVGIDAYEEAGGTILRDLFADEDDRGLWLDDYDLVLQFAEDKLKAAAEEIKDDWRWVEYSLGFGYEDEAKYRKVFPTRGELTEDERADYDGLMDARDLILQDGLNNEVREEYEAIRAKIQEYQELKRERDFFSDEQRKFAGCMVTIDYNGRLKLVEGLVKPGDIPKGEGGSDSGGYKDADTIVREKAGYSKKLMDLMRDERTKIVRSHLSGAFPEAFDLLLFQMAREIFCVERYYNQPLDVELFRYGSRHDASDSIDVGTLATDWASEADDGVAFEKMRSLNDEDKQKLFAACVAITYKGQLTIDAGVKPEVEQVVDDLGIDFATRFRPTVDNFWGRLTKGRMLEIAEETLGAEWADAHAGDKKAVLAQAMEDAFADGDDVPEGVTPEGRKAALAWTPEGFVAD